MRLELGSPVNCTDGPFGELADIVVDPTKRRVTHLVVEPHGDRGKARLVPIELAKGTEASAISVRCSLYGNGIGTGPGYETVPAEYDPHVSMNYDRIPKGEVEIRRASEVLSADGHELGRVDGFLVDDDDAITHFVLERATSGAGEK